MTERRAHWGDELIAAVSTKAVFEGTVTGRLHEGEVYASIAIVEDWLTPRILDVAVGQTRRAITSELRVANAEAQVQAVRDVCADQCFWAEYGPDAELTNAVTVESIFAALEGGQR